MRELTLARGTEGDCYKCGRKIKAGDFIIFKPNFHGGRPNTAVHDDCSPMKVKRHGAKVKR